MRSRPLLVNKERAELMCQPDREYSLVCNVERNFSDQVRRQKRTSESGTIFSVQPMATILETKDHLHVTTGTT
jgi:hypothetical protein